ncbi:MAG: sodium:proton exchanger [Sphingobacteriales bacterium BACL12 MAG-120813-bin55]|jgi:cation:H+ antiporter|nr:MAG: sodium:proton exchanger [Sphingobacteriales bacterium BACL12 MAG-120813-bin55]
MPLLLFLVGLFLVGKGADFLVAGAAALAKRLKISDLVIGLTIVSFGTSAPELSVNLFAAAGGNTAIAAGNVIGSNIFNILVILGTCALIRPLTVQSTTIFKELPFSLLAALAMGFAASDMLFDHASAAVISRTDSALLLLFFAIFMYYAFNMARSGEEMVEDATPVYSLPMSLLRMVGGLTLLLLGGKWMVDSAVTIAAFLGMSEAVIGLTVVAMGTSIPELATSVAAIRRKNSEIAIGNVVGSNIFNIFLILGVTGVIHPLPIAAESQVDLLVLIAITLVLFLLIYNHRQRQLVRVHGILFLSLYAIYLGYLLLFR